jgi:hypothetical protein
LVCGLGPKPEETAKGNGREKRGKQDEFLHVDGPYQRATRAAS